MVTLYNIFNIVGFCSLLLVTALMLVIGVAGVVLSIKEKCGGKMVAVIGIASAIAAALLAHDPTSLPWFHYNSDFNLISNVCANMLVFGGCVTLGIIVVEAAEWLALRRRIVRLERELLR